MNPEATRGSPAFLYSGHVLCNFDELAVRCIMSLMRLVDGTCVWHQHRSGQKNCEIKFHARFLLAISTEPRAKRGRGGLNHQRHLRFLVMMNIIIACNNVHILYKICSLLAAPDG